MEEKWKNSPENGAATKCETIKMLYWSHQFSQRDTWPHGSHVLAPLTEETGKEKIKLDTKNAESISPDEGLNGP